MESVMYKGYTIEITPDDDPINPVEEFDGLGTMVCLHGRYRLGHKQDRSLMPLEHSKKVISLPIYMYDHSGITINTTGFSCPWDSGKLGFIYVEKDKIRKEYGWKKLTKKRVEQVKTYLEGEVEIYDQYLTGSVYGFQITDHEDEDIDDDGSCWGYFGYDHEKSGLLEEARSRIDWEVNNAEDEAREYDLVFSASMEELPVLQGNLKTDIAKELVLERFKQAA